jgi:hypothetical protein
MSTMNSYIRIAATRCSIGKRFVSGICVDTLHKGDTYDDDDYDYDDNNNNNNNNNNFCDMLQSFIRPLSCT